MPVEIDIQRETAVDVRADRGACRRGQRERLADVESQVDRRIHRRERFRKRQRNAEDLVDGIERDLHSARQHTRCVHRLSELLQGLNFLQLFMDDERAVREVRRSSRL